MELGVWGCYILWNSQNTERGGTELRTRSALSVCGQLTSTAEKKASLARLHRNRAQIIRAGACGWVVAELQTSVEARDVNLYIPGPRICSL